MNNGKYTWKDQDTSHSAECRTLLQTRRSTCPCRSCRGYSSRIRLRLPALATLTSASRYPESHCPLRRPQPVICSTRCATTPAPPSSSRRLSPVRRGARERCSRAKCVARRSTDPHCSRDTCAHTQVGPPRPSSCLYTFILSSFSLLFLIFLLFLAFFLLFLLCLSVACVFVSLFLFASVPFYSLSHPLFSFCIRFAFLLLFRPLLTHPFSLDIFATLRKATISFVVSIGPIGTIRLRLVGFS